MMWLTTISVIFCHTTDHYWRVPFCSLESMELASFFCDFDFLQLAWFSKAQADTDSIPCKAGKGAIEKDCDSQIWEFGDACY